MRRGLAITLGIGIIAIFMLCVALATIGAQLDKVTIERNSLRTRLAHLETKIDTLSQERTELKTKSLDRETAIGELQQDLELSLNTIEQLKSELVRIKDQAADGLQTASP